MGGLQLYLEVLPSELRRPERLANGTVRFELVGQAGFQYRIEVSEDLKSWGTLETVTATNAVTVVTDETGPVVGQRFYRAVVE